MTVRESRKCKKCGIEIKPYKNEHDIWVIKDYCINCLPDEELHYLTCKKCKKQFLMNIDRSERKYCPDCSSMNQDEKEVTCERCGKIFLVGRTPDGRHFRHQRICNNCASDNTIKTLICEKCGKEFQVGKYPGTDSFMKRKYCSDFCASSKTEFRNGKVQWKIEKINCKHCGKEIILKRNDKGTIIKRTVCDECLKPKEKEPST